MTGRPITAMRRELRMAWALAVVAAACGGFIVPLGPVDLRSGRTLALRVAFAVSFAAVVVGAVAWRRWRVAQGERMPPARVTPIMWLALSAFTALFAITVAPAGLRRPYLGLALMKLVCAAMHFLDGRSYTAPPSPEST